MEIAKSVKIKRIKTIDLKKYMPSGDEHLANMNFLLKNSLILDLSAIEVLTLISPIIISNNNQPIIIGGLRTKALLLSASKECSSLNVIFVEADLTQINIIELISKYIFPITHSIDKSSQNIFAVFMNS